MSSAQKVTSSQAKLRVYSEARSRDIAAKAIMERDGCSFSDAYLQVLNAESGKLPNRGGP